METRDLLLEIGTEEIPARMLDGGVADLRRLVEDGLRVAGLTSTGTTTFATPRRLALVIEGIPVAQSDREEISYGPSISAAFGPDGAPTKAAMGFARGQGVDPAALERVAGPKGEVVGVRRRIVGRPTAVVLADLLPAALAKLTFPKSMRWGVNSGPFVRPVHWVVCLFGADVVPFELCGVQTGRATCGHRFLFPDPIDVPAPLEYAATLASRGVVVCGAERKDTIVRAMADAEKALGCTFLKNEALLAEVANLVESPVFAVGSFDADFLRLPPEVLITAMGAHQRFFAMQDAGGKLLNRFGVVANTKARDPAVVVRGNERVLAARLYDARFFHEVDRKNGLAAMKARLPERLFLKGVGDMAQKSAWVKALALRICVQAGLPDDVTTTVAEAADLCKADLMSAMVGEFPELQGVMGAYYARPQGEAETPVATAIREHYLPRFSGDATPSTLAGSVLAVADRIDSIYRCFQGGAVPTGSKDPLALRRAAIGAMRILMAQPELAGTTVGRLIAEAIGTESVPPAVTAQLQGFFDDRFRGLLTEDFAVPTDFANATIGFLGEVPPAALAARAQALRDFAGEAADFRDFLDNVFKRVGNLLKQAGEKFPGMADEIVAGGGGDTEGDYGPVLSHELEKAVETTRLAALGAYHSARETGASHDLLAALYSFKEPLARFFGTGRDGVPVLIEEDVPTRVARVALLMRVFNMFSWFADFSRISTR